MRKRAFQKTWFLATVVPIAALGLWFLVFWGGSGVVGGFGGADNPLWLYLVAVLQFPASLLFRPIVNLVMNLFPDDAQAFEIAGAVVAVLEFVLLAVVIKKIKEYWLS